MSFITSMCSLKLNSILPNMNFLLNQYRVFGFFPVNFINEALLSQCFIVFLHLKLRFHFVSRIPCWHAVPSAMTRRTRQKAKLRCPLLCLFDRSLKLRRTPSGKRGILTIMFSNYINSTESVSNHDYKTVLFSPSKAFSSLFTEK